MFTVLIGVLAAVPAFDASASAVANPLLLAQATPSVSADEAVALVRAQSGGRILNLRLENRAQPAVYRIKVLLGWMRFLPVAYAPTRRRLDTVSDWPWCAISWSKPTAARSLSAPAIWVAPPSPSAYRRTKALRISLCLNGINQ